MHWLRQMNVAQHAKIMSIGDIAKSEVLRYFNEVLLVDVPEDFKSKLDFEKIFEVLGGKLAHWQDYVSDFVNSDGKLEGK